MSLTSASRRRPRSPARRRSSGARACLSVCAETIAAERLEQVIERVHFERAQRVLVVGGDEDDRRHPLGADRVDHAEAVDAGHLDVEEDEVRRLVLDGRDRLRAVAALADDFDVLFLLQQRQHALARDRLVVNDQGSDLVHATLSMSDLRARAAD